MATTVHHRKNHSNPFADSLPSSHPPPPPPKSTKHSKHSSRMPSSSSRPHSARDAAPDVFEAVRDTVILRSHQDPPRTRPGRSQTAVTPPSASISRTPPRRSHSQDSANPPRQSNSRSAKKGSKHADVIDRLDYTGVGPMFHHDGPFDACAPSRNRQRNMAPIHSWSPSPEDDFTYGNGAYPGPHAYAAFSNDYPEQPKKKVDAIAEAWGMHEPEPFEEFQAGGGRGDTPSSSIYNGRTGNSKRTTKDGRDAREVYREYLDEGTSHTSRPRITTRRTVPPPQPIFVPRPANTSDEVQSGIPKRSKSLIQRIRQMRDAPNVPVGSDNGSHSSPSSPVDASRPTHRPQHSFLGRFGAKTSPPPNTGFEKSEPYVYVDAHNNKELPAPPRPDTDATFDAPALTYSQSSGPSGSGLGRKTSLMQKVGRVVRGR